MPVPDRKGLKIVDVDAKDVRFPTSLSGDGSDAVHTDPDYSCAYVTITTEDGKQGFGLTFTCGRGTEVVVFTIRSMKRFILGKNVADIFCNFASFWRVLTNDSQMRWIGPEKGVTHLAVAAIINSLWDLWARIENKPLWRLLTDMTPEELVSTIDFRYITDVVTQEEAINLLKCKKAGQKDRVALLLEKGYPAYTTQAGWLGYSDDRLKELCEKYLKLGFTHFKVKVGRSFEDDYRRCSAVRKYIGDDKVMMVDANQVWSVNEAIEWMKKLAPLKPMWIEEPTSPDDVLGHATISKALEYYRSSCFKLDHKSNIGLKQIDAAFVETIVMATFILDIKLLGLYEKDIDTPYGIGVATGEMCANRVLFKQFLQSGGMQYCQIDSARIGGVNEILAVYLMAAKLNVKVCPHAGGVGLCEMVQHLQYWDYTSVSCTMENRLIEYVDQQHEHFTNPCIVENARYLAPKLPGYSTQFLLETLEKFAYPKGTEWKRMIKEGLFPEPNETELIN